MNNKILARIKEYRTEYLHYRRTGTHVEKQAELCGILYGFKLMLDAVEQEIDSMKWIIAPQGNKIEYSRVRHLEALHNNQIDELKQKLATWREALK